MSHAEWDWATFAIAKSARAKQLRLRVEVNWPMSLSADMNAQVRAARATLGIESGT
jgi:hypothetical protein